MGVVHGSKIESRFMAKALAAAAVGLLVLVGGSTLYGLAQRGGAPGGGPENGLNVRPPNALGQKPAFAGQTPEAEC